MKEVTNFMEDVAAYKSDELLLLLAYDHDYDDEYDAAEEGRAQQNEMQQSPPERGNTVRSGAKRVAKSFAFRAFVLPFASRKMRKQKSRRRKNDGAYVPPNSVV